jgi:hypothetical protein
MSEVCCLQELVIPLSLLAAFASCIGTAAADTPIIAADMVDNIIMEVISIVFSH